MSHNYGYCNSTEESREFLKMFRELMKDGSGWCSYTYTVQHIPNDLIYLTKDGLQHPTYTIEMKRKDGKRVTLNILSVGSFAGEVKITVAED